MTSLLRSYRTVSRLITLGLLVSSAAPALAQTTYTWNTTTTSNAWLNSGNWSPAGIPGEQNNANSSNSDIAAIGTFAFTPGNGLGIDMATANGHLGLGALDFTSTTAALQIGNSSGSNGALTLNGATVAGVANTLIAVRGTQNLTIANVPSGSGSQLMDLRLGGPSGVFLVNSGRTLTISSRIIERSANSGFVVRGGGTVVLNGANDNAFTGTVTVGTNSRLRLDNSGVLNNNRLGTTQPVTLNSGILNVTGNNTTGNHTNQQFGTLTVTGLSALTITRQANAQTVVRPASLNPGTSGILIVASDANLGNSIGNGTANLVFTTAPTTYGAGPNSGNTRPILTNVVAIGSNTASLARATLAYYDPVDGVVPLVRNGDSAGAGYSGITTLSAGTGLANTNVFLNGNTTAFAFGSGTAQVNSLTIPFWNITNIFNGTIRVNSGVILISSTASTTYSSAAGITFDLNGQTGRITVLSSTDLIATDRPYTINGVVQNTGSGGLVVSGAYGNTLSLQNSNNTFANGLTVQGLNVQGFPDGPGTNNLNGPSSTPFQLRFAANGSLGNAANSVTVNNASILSTATTTVNRTLNLAGDTFNGIGSTSGTLTWSGLITGANRLTMVGGTVTLSEAGNDYSGGTSVDAGILQAVLGSATATPLGSGRVTLNGGRLDFWVTNGQVRTVANDIVLPATGQQQFIIRAADGSAPTSLGTGVRLTGVLSGGTTGQTYRITDSNASGNHNNVLILDNPNNSMFGILEMWRGTLAITSDAALGNVSRIRHSTENLNGSFRFDADNIVVSASREFEFVTNNPQPVHTQGFTATIAGPLVGSGLMVKQGTGTLILSGTSTNTSPIHIDAGTLRVTGQIGSGAVTVKSGTTLEGSGTVGGTVTVQNGGTIRGGDPTSTTANALTLGNGLTAQSGATVAIRLLTLTPDVSSANPASNSFLNITGGTTTLNAGTNFLIDGSSLAFNSATTYSYRIAAGAGDQSALFINTPSQFSTVNFANASDFVFSVTGNAGGEVFLNIAPVPEPAVVLALAFGTLAVGRRVRRMFRQPTTKAGSLSV